MKPVFAKYDVYFSVVEVPRFTYQIESDEEVTPLESAPEHGNILPPQNIARLNPILWSSYLRFCKGEYLFRPRQDAKLTQPVLIS